MSTGWGLRMMLAGLALLLAGEAGAQQPQRPQPAPAPGPTLAVRNDGDQAINELYVARAGQGARNWGADRLGQQVLEAGKVFRVRLASGFGCIADLRIVFADGAEEVRERQEICRAGELAFARAAPVAPAEREVAVTNASPRPIQFLYVREKGTQGWQEDRLGNDTIDTGATLAVRIPDTGCEVDVRVEFDSAAAEERVGIDICALSDRLTIAPGWTTAADLAAIPPASGAEAPRRPGEARLTLVNRSGRTVFALHVFPDGSREEGPDRLGSDTLADAGRLVVSPTGATDCRYTVKVQYDSGETEQRTGVDLCAVEELVVEPGWVEAALPSGTRIINAGVAPIIALFADPPGAPRGPDRLGDAVLGIGRAMPLAPPVEGQCAYDLLARFRDGREVVRTGIDLCAGEEVRLAP